MNDDINRLMERLLSKKIVGSTSYMCIDLEALTDLSAILGEQLAMEHLLRTIPMKLKEKKV